MSNMSVQRPAASLNTLSTPAAKTAEKPAAQKPQIAIEADNYKRSAANGDLKSGLAATSVTTTTTTTKTITIFPGITVTTDAEAPDTSKHSLANGALKGGLSAAAMIVAPGLAYYATTPGVALDKHLAPTIIASGTIVAGISGAVAGAISSQMTAEPTKGVFYGVLAGAATGVVTGGAIGRSAYGATIGGFVGAIAGIVGGIAGLEATKEE